MRQLTHSLATMAALTLGTYAMAEHHTDDFVGAEAVIDGAISNGSLNFAVAATGGKAGQTWSYAGGHRDAEQTQPASADNIIQIASMTKLITTIAALQLMEQGELDLDSPISLYAPELKDLQVLKGFDADDKPVFENAKRAPTARELMTHTAGYVYEFWNADSLKAAQMGISPSLLNGGNYLAAPLAFQPGTAWEYGINTDWLGVLVERISGKRLAVYFEENIFAPLGMSDTFYELPSNKLDRSVTVMARGAEGLIPLPNFQPTPREKGSMAHYSGGGGLSSTVKDYGRVLQMLLNDGSLDGNTLLKSQTVETMFENNIGEIQPVALATVMPTMSNTADMSFGESATFGLGLLLHTEGMQGGRSANAGSWAGLFNSYYWVDREAGKYGIFGTQVLPFYDTVAIKTLLEFEQAVYK